jgi:hypothetical protein
MNVTLLKNVVDAVVTDNRNLNLVQLLAALENAYAQSVASPTLWKPLLKADNVRSCHQVEMQFLRNLV